MLEFLQITNNPEWARRCDALPGMRLFVDLERIGKVERQAGRNTFISAHEIADVGRIKAVLQRSPLMVRVNPLHDGTAGELNQVLSLGADLVMLPMFTGADEVRAFCALVAGRAPVVLLLETLGALNSLPEWVNTPGLHEVYVGLNDLHIAMGLRFMFEPLALGLLDGVSSLVRAQGLRFGFGGIARLDEGLLPGRDVLAEHVRLGSQAVILSRTFHRSDHGNDVIFEDQIEALRQAERVLQQRNAETVEADRLRIARIIEELAARMPDAGVVRV